MGHNRGPDMGSDRGWGRGPLRVVGTLNCTVPTKILQFKVPTNIRWPPISLFVLLPVWSPLDACCLMVVGTLNCTLSRPLSHPCLTPCLAPCLAPCLTPCLTPYLAPCLNPYLSFSVLTRMLQFKVPTTMRRHGMRGTQTGGETGDETGSETGGQTGVRWGKMKLY